MKLRFVFAALFFFLVSLSARAQCTNFTPNVGLGLPVVGATSAWGTCLNTNFTLLDTLLGGNGTFTPNAATPSVAGYKNWTTANTISTVITNFTGGYPGQQINLLCGDTNTTMASGVNLSLNSGFSCSTALSISLVLKGTVWIEIGRGSGGSSATVSVNGATVSSPNFQDSSSYYYQVTGGNIQLLPQYSEVGPIGIANGNFVAPTFYPTAGSGTPPNPPQGWSPSANTTLAYDQTTAPPNNEFSIKITCIVSAQECAMNNTVIQTLIPGQTYTATAYLRSDGVIGAQLAWEFERSADPVGDLSCFSPPVTSTTWTQVSISCTAGNQDNGFVYITQNDDGASTAGSMWVQDVQVYSNTSQPLDVTTWGARCDGTTDDTIPIQNAINAAAATTAGAVFIPTGRTCVIGSSLNMDGTANVAILGGFGNKAAVGNTQATLKFIGTCSSGACLSMRTTTADVIANVGLTFSGATTGPFIDLSHLNSSDTSLDAFHGVAFGGPGPTVGPIILDQNTDFVRIDDGSTFANASVYIEGPVNNAAFYTDSTTLEDDIFFTPGTATLQNVSIKWIINRVEASLGSGSTCVPFIQYVNSYTNESNLTITNSTFEPGQTGPCTNSFNVVNMPPVVLANDFGGLTFDGNLVLIDTGSTSGNAISLGNNQFLTATGNLFSNTQAVFVVGTGNVLNVGTNSYTNAVSFVTGTPAGGYAIDQNGIQHQYSPFLAAGPQPALTGTGACATLGTKIGSWSGKATCTGTTGASTLVLTPATAAPDGFNCFGSDTTSGLALSQLGVSTTTCTLTISSVTAGDVLSWHVEQF